MTPRAIIYPEEFLRYLRWRVAVNIRGLDHEFTTLTGVFGSDLIIVDDDGTLTSPGNRGKPGDL